MDQPLPFSFEYDTILDLSHMVEFDEMLYDPTGFVNKEANRRQLNVANQNTSTTRVITPPYNKGNEWESRVIDCVFNNILNHMRRHTGSEPWHQLSSILVNTPYIRLAVDKRTHDMEYTVLFTVTSTRAPLVTAPVGEDTLVAGPQRPGKNLLKKRKISGEELTPNSIQKPWVEQEWGRVGGVLVPPPLKSFTIDTSKAAEFTDTMVMSVKFKLDRAGYTVMDQDRSLIMVYGPSSDFRKIGTQFCYIDVEFQDVLGDKASFRAGISSLLPASKLDPRIVIDDHNSLNLIKTQFRQYYKPDPLNREMFGPYQFHTCMSSGDPHIEHQLWDWDFKDRVASSTYDMRRIASTALFKLFIENIKKLNRNSNELGTLKNIGTACHKCWLQNLYSDMAFAMIQASKHLNINSIKEIFPEGYLSEVLHESLVLANEGYMEKKSGRKRVGNALRGHAGKRRMALFVGNPVFDLMKTSVFQTFSEQRKLSILKSYYHGDPKVQGDLEHHVTDTLRMVRLVEEHKHAQKALAELKKRDIRSISSFHEELIFVVEILNTIPVDITNNHQWDFLLGRLDIPDTDLVIRIPTSNVDVKTWGTRQRHCIGSYADDVINEQRVVIGIWDKDKEDWFGHMSFWPNLVAKAQPDEKGYFHIKDFARLSLEVHQFYGAANSPLPEPNRGNVITHMTNCLNDWLYERYRYHDDKEKFIESVDHLSLSRSERGYYTTNKDGEIEYHAEKGKPTFIEFDNRVTTEWMRSRPEHAPRGVNEGPVHRAGVYINAPAYNNNQAGNVVFQQQVRELRAYPLDENGRAIR